LGGSLPAVEEKKDPGGQGPKDQHQRSHMEVQAAPGFLGHTFTPFLFPGVVFTH
jgi:hypothetical protein